MVPVIECCWLFSLIASCVYLSSFAVSLSCPHMLAWDFLSHGRGIFCRSAHTDCMCDDGIAKVSRVQTGVVVTTFGSGGCFLMNQPPSNSSCMFWISASLLPSPLHLELSSSIPQDLVAWHSVEQDVASAPVSLGSALRWICRWGEYEGVLFCKQ